MAKYKLVFVAFDSAKDKHAVAIAEDRRDGEVRYFGEIENSPDAVKKFSSIRPTALLLRGWADRVWPAPPADGSRPRL